jgi:hypothetical protein
MSEKDKKGKPSTEESLVMTGLVSRLLTEEAEGRGDKTLLDVASQIKVDALNTIEGDLTEYQKFLDAVDFVIDSVKERPDLTVSGFIKEQMAKKGKSD